MLFNLLGQSRSCQYWIISKTHVLFGTLNQDLTQLARGDPELSALIIRSPPLHNDQVE